MMGSTASAVEQEFAETIEKNRILLKPPRPTDQEIEEVDLVLIRHAMSEFNLAALEVAKQYGQKSTEMTQIYEDEKMIDPSLHPIGFLQANSNHDAVNEIDFRVVFVSPMRRTLQTASHLFKNHPNLANIKFIVLPLAREVLKNTNDICMDYRKIINMFSQQEHNCGLKFDFSLLEKEGFLWQVNTLALDEKRLEVLNEIKKDTGEADVTQASHDQVCKAVQSALRASRRHEEQQFGFENPNDMLARAANFKQFIRDYMDDNDWKGGLELGPGGSKPKIGTVCHSNFISATTAQGYNPDDVRGYLNPKIAKNCQLIPLPL